MRDNVAACASQLICSICFTALAHYHAAISIDINDPIANEDSKREFRHYNNNSIALSDLSTDADVHPCALKKAHIKEAIACHEEAQRLQRMSRDLKVSLCNARLFADRRSFICRIRAIFP